MEVLKSELNTVMSWVQGKFIDKFSGKRWTKEQARQFEKDEKHLLRHYPTGGAIATFPNPEHAIWVAERLNKLARIEQVMNHDS